MIKRRCVFPRVMERWEPVWFEENEQVTEEGVVNFSNATKCLSTARS